MDDNAVAEKTVRFAPAFPSNMAVPDVMGDVKFKALTAVHPEPLPGSNAVKDVALTL
jgi:hypothetical protein